MDINRIRTDAAAIVSKVDAVEKNAPSNYKRVKALGLIRIDAKDILAEIATAPAPTPVPVPTPVPTSGAIDVKAGQSLQVAYDTAPEGSTLRLEAGATFAGAFVFNRARINLISSVPIPTGRVTPSYGAPIIRSWFDDPITLLGDDNQLIGVRVECANPDAQLIADLAAGTVLDRVIGLGDATKGQHRGILAHGRRSLYTNCHIDNCFLPGRDAQALAGWNGTKDLTVNNCYLGGGAQSAMFGGSDSSSSANVPDGLIFKNNLLTKNPAWRALGAQIKCALELKSARRFYMDRSNTLEYSGADDGQHGNLIVLTPRNQDGNAPWSEIHDVTIDVVGRYSSGIANILGHDEVPSGVLSNVQISGTFTEIDSRKYPGDGLLFLVGDATQDVIINNVSVNGWCWSPFYFYGAPPVRMVIDKVSVPKGVYEPLVDNFGPGLAAVRAFAPDIVISNYTEL